MSEEIELKFIVHPDSVESLLTQLAEWESDYSQYEHMRAQRLSNVYYETADNYLRRNGIGLRIRGENEHYEMTAKTAGKVIGGLHQHPEYNIALEKAELDLSLFPAEVWPEDCDIEALQPSLTPLFSTDFTREKWVFTYYQSVIEVALDRGEIRAGDLTEPLCELEMELKLGQTTHLLALAKEIAEFGGMRQGSLSKAARGYHLAKGNPVRECLPLNTLVVDAKTNIDQAIRAALELALAHWQYHEELWVRGDTSARDAMPQASALMREMLVLVGGVVLRKVTTLFRSALATLENRLQGPGGAEICYSADYLQSKLVLTSWLVESGWRDYMDNKDRIKLQGSFKRFADIMLSRSTAELKSAFSSTLTEAQYEQQIPRLQRNLCAFLLLSGAYPAEQVEAYVEHWRALLQEVERLAAGQAPSVYLEAQRKAVLTLSPFWLHSGGQ
ncbi:inorganic triphosphatase [Pectobacterium parmentieri]|uniref:Inorganic triphosphatase n=1 Tax=Pectobacterium parmentieri TaxID=1905730 RepID=A0A8B3FDR5_PECPM|nr:inorganic triphosphatase [Pectobacterium parmentieri]AOR57457.1 adenylate cyclase [Pectobacterium parmentieri]AYH11503.1 inorganic triphosphatase [Pectobacterium parmentieri]AYH17780.1 inorganic triphosphatase [Pectobacterium parmentieri]AYH37783.1 inorganic triphosphatase [Pectobacterium parmentieri]AZS58014.1 inorganic triphosphatase [Pectobacterium parmentieri]